MSSFTEFLRSKKDEEQAESVNLEKRKSEWLNALNNLFTQIKSWLAEPIAQNLMTIGEEPIELDEYRIGSYQASRLVLKVGHDTVYIEPVGTIILGAKGRVDVKTGGVSFKIVLTDKEEWGILEPDRTVTKRLDEATFTKALQALLS